MGVLGCVKLELVVFRKLKLVAAGNFQQLVMATPSARLSSCVLHRGREQSTEHTMNAGMGCLCSACCAGRTSPWMHVVLHVSTCDQSAVHCLARRRLCCWQTSGLMWRGHSCSLGLQPARPKHSSSHAACTPPAMKCPTQFKGQCWSWWM